MVNPDAAGLARGYNLNIPTTDLFSRTFLKRGYGPQNFSGILVGCPQKVETNVRVVSDGDNSGW
ncbi:MAG: hypothetical protein UX89_C0029G0001 [Parcubacteria group bacterium GW2011_GWA2_47_16]|nr:MAG: hypothetical protein UX89_C0029G0001 [Parcubacteria group bacterium GW2011_GWA2_47_16]